MSGDLLARLLDTSKRHDDCDCIADVEEAADEIERLRSMVDPLRAELAAVKEGNAIQADEIGRLRDAILQACAVMGDDTSDGLPTWPLPSELLIERAREWRQEWDEERRYA